MNTTTNLSSQITGNDYLSAYRSRMEVNNGYFLNIAKELTELGYKVYFPSSDKLISFIRVESEDKHVYFGFTEVPYRWYLNVDINYKEGHGSGKTIKEMYDYDTPYTAIDIISNMQPKQPTITGNSHLKLFTIS